MPKGNVPRSGAKKLTTRKLPGGAQQYVKGKSATDRVLTAGEAVLSTKNNKAQQILLRAQKAEMYPKARADFSKREEEQKMRYLRRGRARSGK
jgi:hypothetical protein